MRIVFANKFWFCSGGVERVAFDEVRALENLGHEVAHFATAHPRNEASPWSGYFPPYIDLGDGAHLGLLDKITAAVRMFSNGEAARRFSKLLEDFRPDVVHAHAIHRQISPSILFVAARLGVPVVETVHDYHHICPGDTLLRGQSTICEPRSCGRIDFTPAVRHRCMDGDLARSALSAAETFFQRVRGSYARCVSLMISPSMFLAHAFKAAGWPTPIRVVPNAVQGGMGIGRAGSSLPGGDGLAEVLDNEEGYFFFCGRLVPEKGLREAAAAADSARVRLVVAGEGPLSGELEGLDRVQRLGWLCEDDARRVLAGSRAAVVPSLWYENAPMSVLEAMSLGVPVVASKVGGIPEQVRDGVDGLLVPAGDVRALTAALSALKEDPERARVMGIAARERTRRDFSMSRHIERLLEVYGEALSGTTVSSGEDVTTCA
ncbi:MAG: glycosyltransferase [Coriobacteriia bacterium]|nr:glycosyltransferase [Coriobacteriia bacterium]